MYSDCDSVSVLFVLHREEEVELSHDRTIVRKCFIYRCEMVERLERTRWMRCVVVALCLLHLGTSYEGILIDLRAEHEARIGHTCMITDW